MIQKMAWSSVAVLAGLATITIATSSAAASGISVPPYSSERVQESVPSETRDDLEYISPEDEARLVLTHPFTDAIAEFDGYEGAALGHAINEVTVYWSGGAENGDLQKVHVLAASAGIDLRVVETAYSDTEIRELFSKVAVALGEASIEISGIAYAPPYWSIHFSGPELSESPALQEEATRIASTVLPDDVTLGFMPYNPPIQMSWGYTDRAQHEYSAITPGGMRLK